MPAPLRGPAPEGRIRVALVTDPAGLGTAMQVQDGVRKAAAILRSAGYAIDEIEPPSVASAASTGLAMLATPELRATWELLSPLIPADTQRFRSACYDAVHRPDHADQPSVTLGPRAGTNATYVASPAGG